MKTIARKRPCQNVLIAGICAALIALILVAAQSARADAAELQASNTTSESAINIPSGTSKTFSIDVNGQETYYWFKFKTSSRNSVYQVKIASIDGSGLTFAYLDDEMTSLDSDWIYPKLTTRTYPLKLRGSYDKNKYFYIRLTNDTVYRPSYGDRFRVTVTECPILKKVTGVKAAKKTKNSLTVKWTKQVNATKYKVSYRIKGGTWKTKTTTSNSVKLTKLKKSKTYQVRVRAYNKNGYSTSADKCSSWSNWSAVKTLKTKK